MKKQDLKIKIAKTEKDFLKGAELIIEYVDWLGIDLSFQNFDNEINDLREMYSKPNGVLILASIGNKVVGVTGIRKFDSEDCELKRMFVRKEYRNLGVGKIILEKAIALAKELNYSKIKLDTNSSMQTAIKLYLDYGFEEIPPYRYNPEKSARFFELKLE